MTNKTIEERISEVTEQLDELSSISMPNSTYKELLDIVIAQTTQIKTYQKTIDDLLDKNVDIEELIKTINSQAEQIAEYKRALDEYTTKNMILEEMIEENQ